MSYFRRIVDRTLGQGQPLARPALTPDLIPENPARTKGAPAGRTRKYLLPENAAGERLASNVAGNPVEGSLRENAKKNDPETPEEYHMDVLPAAELKEAKSSVDKESGNADTPDHEISEISSAEKLVSSETAVNMLQPDKGVESRRAKDGTLPMISPSRESAGPVAGKETGKAQLASEQPLEPAQVLPSPNGDTSFMSSKTDREGQQEYPSLVPKEYGRTKFPMPVSQPEETVVTINIGRIEVRAESPVEPVRNPRQKFSPALSLADYLKQRSEGRLG